MPASDPRSTGKRWHSHRVPRARRRGGRFVLPATIFFLAWYIGFVLLAGYAPDFMKRSVYEGLTVGYCLALTQFVMVGALGLAYLRRAERVFDPLAEAVVRVAHDPTLAPSAAGARPAGAPTTHDSDRRHQRRGARDLRDRPLDHARHHVLGVQRMTGAAAFWAAGRSITGLQNGLAISGDYLSRRVVPRHRRPDLPLRLRRLPVLRRLPRRVPDGHVPARRADAQRGQVHDRRRALLPPARAAGARRGGDGHARRSRPSTSSRRWSAPAC